MTSKSSFIKLLQEDGKRRIWSIALSALAFIILFPILCAVQVSNFRGGISLEWELDQVAGMVGSRNDITIFAVILCAVVCGLSGFYYLHSRKKVDFYHSIPVRREVLFLASYLNGIFIYFIPYVISLCLSLIVLKANDYINQEIVLAALAGIGINLLFFCLIYTVTIIAVMLTGNLIISICGTGVFLVYVPAVRELKDALCLSFFSSYFTRRETLGISSFLSPIENYVNIAFGSLKGSRYIYGIVITCAITLVLFGLAILLYRKRPSETAGKSMTFAAAKPIIKFFLVVPLSLGGGIFLKNIVSLGYNGWFVFGTVFAFIISYGLIQVLYEFDIKSAFQHKLQMLVCAVLVVVIAAVLQLDVFGYDRYLPKKEEIQNISVAIAGIDGGMNYYDVSNGEIKYWGRAEYELANMKLKDFSAAYEIAKIGSRRGIGRAGRNDYRAYGVDKEAFSYYVKYTLKSGKTAYRCYGIRLKDCKDLLNEVYSDQGYKDTHYMIYQWEKGIIDQISVAYEMDILNYVSNNRYSREDYRFSLVGDSVEKFIQIYKEELKNLTLEEMASGAPIATLTFERNLFGKNNYVGYNEYHVYPSFVKTLAFLEENGFDVTKKIDIDNVVEISIYDRKQMERTYTYEAKAGVTVDVQAYEPLSYTEKEDILGLLPALLPMDYCQNNMAFVAVEPNIEVYVTYRLGENGLAESFSYRILKDKLPDKVKEDLGW